MSELRRQFRSISPKELKILIIANLDFIRDATPFPETEEIISGIRAKVEAINEMNNLQQTLLNLMKIVQYWDTHQNQKSLFPAVEKDIVNKMLSKAVHEKSLSFKK